MSAILDLTQLNVWIDVVFTTLYVAVICGLAAHFILGNVIVSGRAYRRFVKWEGWPHHDGPPVPFLQKYLHFEHASMMVLLAASGMLIRFHPVFRDFWRYVHYFAMIVVTVNLVWRLWYAFYARTRDWREFAITKKDLQVAPKVVLYYLFIKPSKPHVAKYNVMQKGTYLAFVPLMFIQAFTGFALLTQPFIFGFSPRELLVGWWLGPLVQSADLAGWYARIVHYLVNWLFIVLTTVHVYLSVTEDFPAFLNFFGLSFLDRGHSHGDEEHADHGEGEDVHAPDIHALPDVD